ncbi:unnamed protein product [Phaedon cochleariae]|uniref:CRAL-TRIO domain-containing protein n=1 Tax=Phaedon cochleariae TaxID=80249 RepID=A0A9N9SNV9_PHACE|nr:unnamed protein product [Phaedon cochleariae]
MSEYIEYNWRTSTTIEEALRNSRKPNDQNHRTNALKDLQKLIQSYEEPLPQDEKTLQKFLHARKYDVPESFELFKNYFSYRKQHPEVFSNLTLESQDIISAIENGLPGVLPQKDRKGRSVLVFTGANWDCSYPLLSIYRALWLILERYIEHIHNQTNGFVVIVDWTEFTFRQTSNLKPSILKLMIEGLQDCFPARFKGVHFIGQSWYVEMALAVIKPFLNEKIKERIYVHGNNLSTLHEHVHKDVLPTDMGGEQPSYNPETFLASLRVKGDVKK